MRVERQIDLKEAEHDPSEVLHLTRVLSKEQALCKDDRRLSPGVGKKPCSREGRNWMEALQVSHRKSIHRKFLMVEGSI